MPEAALLPSDMVRAPRLLVLVNGVPLARASEASVTSGGYFGADRFRVQAALAGDAAVWASLPQIAVDVQISLSPLAGFVSLVQGMADAVEIDPLRGTLTLEGRDLSAALMEARTQETFANRTSSDIAAILAGRHGLAVDAQATSTPVGRYWELEHDKLTLNAATHSTTEWDLLVGLAQHEGFDLWVSGGVLHFRPAEQSPPNAIFMNSVTSLRLERALTFAGDIVVTVKSWHSRAGIGCVGVAQTSRGAASTQNYVFVVPNLTQDAANTLARAHLNQLTAHEWRMRAEMPGELTLATRQGLQLLGTGTLFDTVYRIDEIERRLHATHGFSQVVRARAASGEP